MDLTRKPGQCLVITGVSGGGKSTVAAAVLERLPQAARMVTTTSRPPRPGEVEGVHYHFKSREDFLAAVANEEFLEYEDNYGKLYGSSARVLRDMRRQHEWVIAVIDPKGARTYLEKVPGCLTVFLTAPVDQLRVRLAARTGMAPGELQKRLAKGAEERAMGDLFHHVIENADGKLDQTLTALYHVMAGHGRT